MYDNQNEVYSVKVRAGSRTYFLNVKEDKNSNLYLVLKESKLSQDGRNEVHRIMVFEDDFSKFMDGIKDVLGFIKKHNEENKKDTLDSDNSDDMMDFDIS